MRVMGRFCNVFALCAVFGVFVLTSLPSSGYAQDVVLLHGKQPHEMEEQQIQALASFYGVGLISADTGSPGAVAQAMQRVAAPGTLAVLAAEDALAGIDMRSLRGALDRRGKASTPLLIFGIAAKGNTDTLKAWSAGNIS